MDQRDYLAHERLAQNQAAQRPLSLGQAVQFRPAPATDATLRDQFAMAAPPVPDWFKFDTGTNKPHWDATKEDVEAWRNACREQKFFAWRWYYADAMLAARGKA